MNRSEASGVFKLEREKTDLTPYVLIDEEKKYMKLEGESYHENVTLFFKDITEWMTGFLEKDFDSFTFDCCLTYFSSSTVKVLLNIFLDMDNSKNAKNINVNWITTKKNKIIIECGEDYKEDMKNIVFNIVVKD